MECQMNWYTNIKFQGFTDDKASKFVQRETATGGRHITGNNPLLLSYIPKADLDGDEEPLASIESINKK